jgi:hypothetical protein
VQNSVRLPSRGNPRPTLNRGKIEAPCVEGCPRHTAPLMLPLSSSRFSACAFARRSRRPARFRSSSQHAASEARTAGDGGSVAP